MNRLLNRLVPLVLVGLVACAQSHAESAPTRVEGTVSLVDGFAPILAHVSPAVVSMWSTKIVRTRHPNMLPFFDFDGDGDGESDGGGGSHREQGLGSGVIVGEGGVILTNNHVVQDASEVRVTLSDKRELRAKVIGTDPKTDIAVIKIEAKGLPFVALGDSTKVRVGEFALAIGNPFGIGQTATFGIISAVGRSNVHIADYEDFIQTDAAINPGNSGGALVNAKGDLIGINTAILSRSGGNQGIGLAVPSQIARHVMEQILKNGKVVRGWLGVAIQDVDPAMAEALGLKATKGALVGDVTLGSPAAKAGFKRGEVIVELDGHAVDSGRDLRNRVSQMAPGSKVKLVVVSGGAKRELTVVLGELPEKFASRSLDGQPSTPEGLGLEVAPLSPNVMQKLDLPPGTTGVLVAKVQRDSPAADVGLRPGDVITEANQRVVANPSALAEEFHKSRGKRMALLVLREGATSYVSIEVPSRGTR